MQLLVCLLVLALSSTARAANGEWILQELPEDGQLFVSMKSTDGKFYGEVSLDRLDSIRRTRFFIIAGSEEEIEKPLNTTSVHGKPLVFVKSKSPNADAYDAHWKDVHPNSDVINAIINATTVKDKHFRLLSVLGFDSESTASFLEALHKAQVKLDAVSINGRSGVVLNETDLIPFIKAVEPKSLSINEPIRIPKLTEAFFKEPAVKALHTLQITPVQVNEIDDEALAGLAASVVHFGRVNKITENGLHRFLLDVLSHKKIGAYKEIQLGKPDYPLESKITVDDIKELSLHFDPPEDGDLRLFEEKFRRERFVNEETKVDEYVKLRLYKNNH